MFIKYKPKDPHVKTIPMVATTSGGKAVPLANDSVILRPGTNELTENEWAAIQPHIQNEIAHHIIVPFTVEVKKSGGVIKAGTLKDVPVSVARKIIESCQNVADLKKWGKQELPDEIMLLVLKRLRTFRIDPDEFRDDLAGEDTLDADITPEGSDEGNPANEETGEADVAASESKNARSTKRNRKSKEETKDSGSSEGDGDDPEADDDEEIPDFDGSRNG
jgi:hypothetical protein